MNNKIKEIRKIYNFTQEELATHIGVSYTTINRWETLKAHPSKKNQKIINALMNNIEKNKYQDSNNTLRPIQYLGSKKKLTNQILEIIHELVPNGTTVCDIFSGSGVVSSALSEHYNTISVDIQKYSSVLSEVVSSSLTLHEKDINNFTSKVESSQITSKLKNIFMPLINYENECLLKVQEGDGEQLSEFIENCSVYKYMHGDNKNVSRELSTHLKQVIQNIFYIDEKLKKSILISTYYGGIYFSFEQAVLMDSILYHSKNLNDEKKGHELLALLLSSASYIVNTVGKQFAQPIKLTNPQGQIKKLLLGRTIRDRNISVFQTFKKQYDDYKKIKFTNHFIHKVFNMDYNDFLTNYTGSINCFYADPPYTIDHYSRFYHVLETISLYDFPDIDFRMINGQKEYMRGMYRNDRHQSPFSISSKVKDAFERLFRGIKKFSAPLVLSYSPSNLDKNGRARLLELEEIKKLAKKYFKFVYFIEANEHSHKKLNSKHRNVEIFENAEIFIVCAHKEMKKWKNI